MQKKIHIDYLFRDLVVIHSRLLLSKATPEMKILGLRKQKTMVNVPREVILCD